MDFWQQLLREREKLLNRHPGARTMIVGDCNVHLSFLVDHHDRCGCAHCRQSLVDRRIESLLQAAGLFPASRRDVATHSSGTIIDLVLIDCSISSMSTVHSLLPGQVANSDHGLVYFTLLISESLDYRKGFGRVSWASNKDWSLILEAASFGL